MAEDRPLEDAETAIGRIDGDLADFKATILARLSRKPVGDVELAFRPSPKEGTIFLQGQTLDRATYPALWAWVQEVGALVTGGYTAGNGTTTFTVPDMRDKFIIGAGGAVAFGGTGGNASQTLSVANMPPHDHNVTVSLSQHEGHAHDIFANGGNHGAHFPGTQINVGSGAGTIYGLAAWNSGGTGNVAHDHTESIEGGGKPHSVSVGESSAGSGTAFDNRPPYLGINVAVWV